MRVTCKKCMPGEEILIPDFSHTEKETLLKVMTQSPLQVIKYVLNNYTVNHRYAKFIVCHINKIYGHCNRCNFEKLEGEYIACLKCGALNFNWRRT